MGTYGKSRVNGPTTLSTQTLDTPTDQARTAASTGTKPRTSIKRKPNLRTHSQVRLFSIRDYAGAASCDKNSAPISRFFHQAPSIRKLLRLGGASAALTSTSSTRAARGPCLSLASRAASCCALPLARTSTAPSTLLRTQPARPSIGLALHKP